MSEIDGTLKLRFFNSTKSKKRRRRRRRTGKCNPVSLFLGVILFLAVFLALPLIVWWPFGDETVNIETRIRPGKAADRIRPQDCTVGEVFSNNLKMCRPKLPYPQAWDRGIMNDEIQACDSFFNHACGKWIDSHTNENRAFTYIRKENEKQISDIVKNPETMGVYQFYRSCVNTMVDMKYEHETKNQVQFIMGKVKQHLVRHRDLHKAFALMVRYGYTIPFQMTIEDHPTKPKLVPQFRYDGFSDLDKREAMVRTQFEKIYGVTPQASHKTGIVIKMNRALNYMKPESIESIVDYTKSGKLSKDTMSYSQFKNVSKGLDWNLFLQELSKLMGPDGAIDFEEDQEVWAIDSAYFMWFDPSTFTIEEWKAYFEFSVIYHSTDFFPKLPNDSYLTDQGIRSKLSKRIEDSTVTENDCIHATNYLLPGLLAKQFLKEQFPEAEKVREKVIVLVENIRDRFAELIQETHWMDKATKKKAVEKVRSIIVRAVHPTQWKEEGFGQEMAHDTYLRNLNFIRQYRIKRNLDLWESSENGTLFDRDSISNFGGPLSTVNAWYSPSTNTITIFPGILRAPFFHLKYSEASLYGSIGLVAAHELSHSMDDIGRLFDKDGSFIDWWSQSSKDGFHKNALCIIKEYVTPEGCDGERYGEQTLCEDIADIVGIKLSFEAFVHSQSRKGKLVTQDEKRLFFYTFAQNWCENYDQETLCSRVNDDVHAIARYRVDQTLRQIDHFSKAFGCHKGTNMVHETPCVMYGEN